MALVLYKEQNGHTRVPATLKELSLGVWVQKLRHAYKAWKDGKVELKRSLTQERIQKLDALGFEWQLPDSKQDMWDQRLQELISYKKEHGDMNVPSKYLPNEALWHWVRNARMCYKARFQERKKGGATPLSDERVRILNAIEFEWRVS
uniref:Helicase-associated domain-containing protein n=2 Tax=Odontella aurita TaxID=265563 RepID=A0A7S4IYU7_9STRA|mmetsp:Transcript_33550/g.99992  ORF Transcript_33550/g.99992 Transcript_33550/m.99992 type:complete len:148 (+) Transcript_33550:222-665(+)